MMRIITGRAKGIRLKTLEGDATRPTAERVKEAVFSMIQFDMEGREVLDLFAGSGQMGLEAVSRGAEHAVLVDKSSDAIRIIEENAIKTKLAPDCTIKQADATEYIRRNRGKKFDIVFLDPPYASGLYAPILIALSEADMLKPSSMVICEGDTEDLLEKHTALGEYYRVKKTSKYSKTVITILEPNTKEMI